MPDGNKEEDENDDDRNSDDEDELERQMGDLADDNKDVRAVALTSVCVCGIFTRWLTREYPGGVPIRW